MNKLGLSMIAVVAQANFDLKLALMMEEDGVEWAGPH